MLLLEQSSTHTSPPGTRPTSHPTPPSSTTMKTPTQTPPTALSINFGSAWEPLSSQKAHFVSSNPLHTFLVCMWHKQYWHLNQILSGEDSVPFLQSDWYTNSNGFTPPLKIYPQTQLEKPYQKLWASSFVAFGQDITYIKLMPLF